MCVMKNYLTSILIMLTVTSTSAREVLSFDWLGLEKKEFVLFEGGCTDPLACNFDPAASFDDGSCCLENCVTINIGPSDFPSEISYVLQDANGTEYLNVTSGPNPASYDLCLPDGCFVFHMYDAFGDGWNNGTYEIILNNTDEVKEAGLFPNDPAYEAFQKDAYFVLGPGMLGCDDPLACNFDPSVTCNNGSCDYVSCYGCMDPVACNFNAAAIYDDGSCCVGNCITLELIDYVGDGWDDGTYTIYDTNMNLVVEGTLLSPLSYEAQSLCLADGCYFFSVQGSGYPEEIEWYLSGIDAGATGGDGLTVTEAYFSVGGGACFGCTDPEACTYNPFAFIDDDSCIEGPCVAYDNPWTARPTSLTDYPGCSTITETLVGATRTQVATSAYVTGEDIWFAFTAITDGASFQVNSSNADIALELLDATYHTITSVNLRSGIGGENLNLDDLTPGETYYLGVRNFNSALGTGNFTLCAQNLRRSACPTNLGPYDVCGIMKAQFAGTSGYMFNFTNTLTAETSSYFSATSTSILLSNVPNLFPDTEYQLAVQSVFQLPNSLGVNSYYYVEPASSCTITTLAPKLVKVNETYSCSNYGAIPRSRYIPFNPRVCGAIGYQIELVNQDGIQPTIIYNSMTTTRFFRFSQIPDAQNGAFYDVRVRPLFDSEYEAPFGAVVCLQVAGTSSFWTISNNFTEEEEEAERDDVLFIASTYPNPSTGSELNVLINTDSERAVTYTIYDMTGKLVFKKTSIVDGELNQPLELDRQLATGIYSVIFESGDERITQRMIIQNQ